MKILTVTLAGAALFVAIISATQNREGVVGLKSIIFENSQSEALENPFLKRYKCFVDVCADVCKRNGLDDLWARTDAGLQKHYKLWAMCNDLGFNLFVQICKTKRGIEIYKVLDQFIQTIADENNEASLEIVRDYIQYCKMVPLTEIFSFNSNRDKAVYTFPPSGSDIETFGDNSYFSIEHLKCIIRATAVAVLDSELADTWIEYHKQLLQALARIEGCTKLKNGIKDCVVAETKKMFQIMLNYWKYLADKRHFAILDKIRQKIKDECY